MRRMRKQFSCRCGAYGFPHRLGGGRCTGLCLVERNSYCRDCHLNNNGCEVLSGLEHPRECPLVQDFMAQWEIKL